MKTIQTKPDCTLGFVEVPEGSKAFKIDRLAHTILVQLSTNVDDNDLDYYALTCEKAIITLPTDKEPNVISLLSETTEEQAKGLVIRNGAKEFDTITIEPALPVLKSAALSVGIEEKDFDSYLVVKL